MIERCSAINCNIISSLRWATHGREMAILDDQIHHHQTPCRNKKKKKVGNCERIRIGGYSHDIFVLIQILNG